MRPVPFHRMIWIYLAFIIAAVTLSVLWVASASEADARGGRGAAMSARGGGGGGFSRGGGGGRSMSRGSYSRGSAAGNRGYSDSRGGY